MIEKPDLSNLSPAELELLRGSLKSEMEVRAREDPAEWFPTHPRQDRFLELAEWVVRRYGSLRLLLAIGGNRSGKSTIGKLLLGKILRREHPIFWQFTKMDRFTGQRIPIGRDDPLNIWVVPPTDEKLRNDIWDPPTPEESLEHFIGPDLITRNIRSSGRFEMETVYGDKILGKTQRQDIMTFESSAVHIIWWDEEPDDEQKFNSGLLRLGTTNGITMMTFTPLRGLSWSYDRLFKPLVEQGRAQAWDDRAWTHTPDEGRKVVIVQMGTADNPLAVDYAKEVEADPEISEAEKDSRLFGKYGYVEGALLPSLSGLDIEFPKGAHELYVVDRLPGVPYEEDGRREIIPGRIKQWLLVADPNKSFGATLAALDGNGNLFFVKSHLEEGWADAQHVDRLRAIEREFGVTDVRRYADYGGAGAHSQVNMAYHGMPFQNVPKGAGSVSETIKKLRGAAYVDPRHSHPITGEKGAPRLYFYRPGLLEHQVTLEGRVVRSSPLVQQISQARQSDNPRDPVDTPHKDVKNRLDLFDCARYTAKIANMTPVADEGEVHRRREEQARRKTNLPTDASQRSQGPKRGSLYDFEVPSYEVPT